MDFFDVVQFFWAGVKGVKVRTGISFWIKHILNCWHQVDIWWLTLISIEVFAKVLICYYNTFFGTFFEQNSYFNFGLVNFMFWYIAITFVRLFRIRFAVWHFRCHIAHVIWTWFLEIVKFVFLLIARSCFSRSLHNTACCLWRFCQLIKLKCSTISHSSSVPSGL